MAENKPIDWGNACILVARVSTPEQVLNENVSPQIADLKKFARQKGYTKFKEINTVESGFLINDKKIGWNVVTNFIEENPEYRTIVITEMSRLSRVKEILYHIQGYLSTHKIQLYIKDIPDFKLLNDKGEVDFGRDLIFSLYASLAAMEMNQKRERFRRAKKEYRKLGYSIGGRRLFGYKREHDKEFQDKSYYKENEVEAAEIRQIFVWYAYGINNDLTKTSIANICLECRANGFSEFLHSKRNVAKTLREKAYTGVKITHNKMKNPEYFNYKEYDKPKYIYSEEYECKYPIIIEQSLFDLVQERLAANNFHLDSKTKVDKSSKHITILAKILCCQYCKSYFLADYRMRSGLPKFSYRCSGARGRKELRKCEHSQMMSMRLLDSAVWTFLKNKVENILNLQRSSMDDAKKKEIQSKIDNLRKELPCFDGRVKRAIVIYKKTSKLFNDEDEALKDFEAECAKIEREKDKTIKQIKDYEHALDLFKNTNDVDVSYQLSHNIEKIENNKQLLYNYVHLLIKEIVPLYNSTTRLVLKITALNNVEEALNFAEKSVYGLPTIANEKNDGVYFVVIKKTTRPIFYMRVIDDCLIKYDVNSNVFIDVDKEYTIDDIFDIDLSCKTPIPLAISITEPIITYLDCYKADVPNSDTEELVKNSDVEYR